MAKGRPKSETGSSDDSSSGSTSTNSGSSSDDSSGKSSRESSPVQRPRSRNTQRNGGKSHPPARKKHDKPRHKSADSPKHRDTREPTRHTPRSPSRSPPQEATSPKERSRGIPIRSPSASPLASASQESQEDVHMRRSEDELSIGPGGGDDYQDELVQEAADASQEIAQKSSKPRRDDLSSGEVTSDGESDDSDSWRENRVRSMLQSHVEKPSHDGPHRESYEKYESDHEGAQPFRSVVGTTITRPGQQRYSDSGEITDSDEEAERDRRAPRQKYSRRSAGSPDNRRSSHSGRDRDQRRSRDAGREPSRNQRNGRGDHNDKEGRDRDSSWDRRRGRRPRSRDRSGERKEKRREHKADDQYEDARVKFRKRVWDEKEKKSQDKPDDLDASRTIEDGKRKDGEKEPTPEPPPPKKKKPEVDMLSTKTGGAYIPPAKLKMMQEAITDKTSPAYQRMAWEALKKSINGLINKVNVPNIALIVQELLQLNVVRGRGLLAKSIIAAQTASPTFTHVYASLVSIINTKFPQNGELLIRRLIINFKKGYRRNDKTLCMSSTRFLAHLVNQQVAHEILALEILTLLLENVTDDSVEVAVGFVKECGLKLLEVSPRGIHAIFERMRNILHEAQIDKRVQYMVEVVFANRKDNFKDYPSIVTELDLVEESDQFTHLLTLEDTYQSEDLLNVFKIDEEYIENEEKYKGIKREILDEGSDDSDSDGESGEASSSGEGSDNEAAEAQKMEIIDRTETNLVALRRIIYLTIQSSLDFEECAHKMLKMDFKPGQEREVCMMIIDCCAQQRTYEKFFGLLAQRFCTLKREYMREFEGIFPEQYATCHRLDTNKLRNVAKMFSHLLHTDAISWTVMLAVRMNEEDTTSSSRIFIKILFLELSEYLGLPKLNDRLKDKTLMPYFEGLLPRDNPANTRFAINFFTTIGLGGLTDDLRDHLKNVQKQIMQQRQPVLPSDSDSSSSDESSSSSSESSSSSSSSSSSDSSSGSSSESDRGKSKKKKKKKKSKVTKKKSKSKSSKKEDGEKKTKEQRSWKDEKSDRRDLHSAENSQQDARRKKVNDREVEDNRTRHNNRDTRHIARDTRHNDKDTRHDKNARQNDRDTSRHNDMGRTDGEQRQKESRGRNRAEDEEQPRSTRNDARNRDDSRGNDRQQMERKEVKRNDKRSKKQIEEKEDSDSSESDSSSSESSSSDSDSSGDASPPPQKNVSNKQAAKNGRNREGAVRHTSNDRGAQQGRGGQRELRDNYSDKENQRGTRQRTVSRSDSDGIQKRRDSGRDFIRNNDIPNNDYPDPRQARGDGRDGRRNRDDQYDRGNARGDQRTRYDSRGEDEPMNNARNRDFARPDRMESDGFDRRNDRGDRGRGGRNRYDSDKAVPPRYNDDTYGRKDRRQGFLGSPERGRREFGGGADRGMRRDREFRR